MQKNYEQQFNQNFVIRIAKLRTKVLYSRKMYLVETLRLKNERKLSFNIFSLDIFMLFYKNIFYSQFNACR